MSLIDMQREIDNCPQCQAAEAHRLSTYSGSVTTERQICEYHWRVAIEKGRKP